MTTILWHQRVWNYFGDEINDENDNDNDMINNNKTTKSKSFKYKAKIIWSTSDNGSRLNVEVVVSLKYLSNFWISFQLPLINYNCEIEFDLRWVNNCIMLEI